MIRKAAVALALLLLTVSIRLNALGLGEIEMQSALNQPMKADISLTSVAGVDTSQIKIALASREAHERLGLSRAKILNNFKFEVVGDGGGMAVIKVSGTEPVREPYLEFLLEMVWENGRMVREYTVLVDPPVTMPGTPVAPVAPVVPAPAVVPAVSQPARQARPVAQTAPTTYRPAVGKRIADSYGPVRREEALWSIAQKLRPDGDITIQQMMIALLRANPQAFPDNNINNLKAGSTLKIPGREEILALSARQASAEAGRQYDEWLDRRNAARVLASKPAVEETAAVEEPVVDMPARPVAPETRAEAQLKLTAPEGDPVAGSATSSGEAVVPGSEAAGDESIRQQLALAAEEIEAGKAQSDELRSRVVELEATIKRMERLLELKSDPLASLQNNAGNMDVEPVPGDEAVEDTVLDTEVEVPVAETGEEVPAGSDGEIAAMETGDTAEAEDATEGEDATEAEDAAPEEVTADDAELPVSETRGIVNRLMDNPVLAGLGVLVAMLLGGFLWGSMRRQGNKGMFDDEPTLDKQVAAGSDEASKPAEPAVTVSDPGTFDMDTPDNLEGYPEEGANDPVTEADVYLAYGRVHQAEDVLQAALKEDPDNLAIRAKLLEVFHAAGNVAAFNIAASEYRELAPEDDAQWSGIAAFGYELSPGNELYSAAKQISGDTSHSADFDMDLSGLNDVSDRTEATADTDDLALTMDADVDAETGEAGERPESIEFSLDETGEDEAQGEGLLASTDEVATKLDLARAYLDMEDPEGARSILQEVMEEGNAEQRSEAESLISNIV